MLSWTVEQRTEARLDRALATIFPEFSRVRIQSLLNEGRILVDGQPARPSDKPLIGQVITIDIPPPVDTGLVPENIPLDVLYEDDDIIVLCKAAGMVVHPGAGHSTGTLVHALLGRGPLSTIGGELRPGIVHRLDVGTSGVMVVAHNDVAHRHLARQFEAHTNDRRYLAVVHKIPLFDRGTIRSRIGRDPQNRQKFATVGEYVPDLQEDGSETEEQGYIAGRNAVTHWERKARGDRMSLLECRLETGRTHQIRVHLSEAGHPLMGDPTYTRRECTPPMGLRPLVEAMGRPLLHAASLEFDHPKTEKRLLFKAPPPKDFIEFCAAAELSIPGTYLRRHAGPV